MRTLKKIGWLFLGLTTISTTSHADSKDFIVTTGVRSAVTFLNDVKVTVKSQEVKWRTLSSGKKIPIGSEIIFDITGSYQGGYCPFDEIVVRQAIDIKNYPTRNIMLTLEALDHSSDGVFQSGEAACMDGSFGKFDLPVKLTVTNWGTPSVVNWKYSIPLTAPEFAGNQPPKRVEFSAALDADKGQWTFIPPVK